MFNQEVLQLEAWVSRFSLILMVSWCPKLKIQLFCFVNYMRLLTKVSSDSLSMKLINMITCVSMRNGYHLSKSSGLSPTCMAPKSPFSYIGTQPASNRLSHLFISGAAIAFSTSDSQPLHLEHFAWDRSNKLPYHCFCGIKDPFCHTKAWWPPSVCACLSWHFLWL